MTDNRRLHADMVRYADAILGRLIEALERTGQRQRTLVIWTSDNGSAIGGRLAGRRVPGGKGKTTELGVCVPTIVSWPGPVPAGQTSRALFDFTDFLPTLVDLAGGSPEAGYPVHGVSQLPVWLGHQSASVRPWILAMGGGNNARLTEAGVENAWVFRDRVIRDERFKLYVGTDGQPQRLIDLKRDPWEESDVLDSPDPELQQALARLRAAVQALPPRDRDPQYGPPQPAYVPISAASGQWKQGLPVDHP